LGGGARAVEDGSAEDEGQDAGDEEPADGGLQRGDQAAVVGYGAVDELADLAQAGLAQRRLRRHLQVIDDARNEQDRAQREHCDADRLPSPHGPLPTLGVPLARLR
jgi:hypothetical protein